MADELTDAVSYRNMKMFVSVSFFRVNVYVH